MHVNELMSNVTKTTGKAGLGLCETLWRVTQQLVLHKVLYKLKNNN